jgi:hypothetical protein
MGTIGRRRSLGEPLWQVRKSRGEVERTILYIKGGSKLSSEGRAQQALARHAQRCPYAPVARLQMADDIAEVRARRRSVTQQGRRS